MISKISGINFRQSRLLLKILARRRRRRRKKKEEDKGEGRRRKKRSEKENEGRKEEREKTFFFFLPKRIYNILEHVRNINIILFYDLFQRRELKLREVNIYCLNPQSKQMDGLKLCAALSTVPHCPDKQQLRWKENLVMPPPNPRFEWENPATHLYKGTSLLCWENHALAYS